MLLIFLTLLCTKLTSAIPCAGFALGTVPYGNDIISDGVAKMDSTWDGNRTNFIIPNSRKLDIHIVALCVQSSFTYYFTRSLKVLCTLIT